MDKIKKSSNYYKFVSASMAFLLWGGWAFYINYEGIENSGFISGITQGTASFLITLFMIYIVTYLYHYFKKPILKIGLSAILTISLTGTCLVIIHGLISTPNILYTVFPPLCVAFIFCLFTTFKLNKINLQENYE